jgi:hypothetical protein
MANGMALFSSDILCLRLSLPDVFETLSFSSSRTKEKEKSEERAGQEMSP